MSIDDLMGLSGKSTKAMLRRFVQPDLVTATPEPGTVAVVLNGDERRLGAIVERLHLAGRREVGRPVRCYRWGERGGWIRIRSARRAERTGRTSATVRAVKIIDRSVRAVVKRGWQIVPYCTIRFWDKACCPAVAVALAQNGPQSVRQDPRIEDTVAEMLGVKPDWVSGFMDGFDQLVPTCLAEDERAYLRGYAAGQKYRRKRESTAGGQKLLARDLAAVLTGSRQENRKC